MDELDSGCIAEDCKTEEADSQMYPFESGVDNNKSEIKLGPHPVLLIKRLPGFSFNQGLQVSLMTPNNFHQPKKILPSISYEKEDIPIDESNTVISGKMVSPVKIQTYMLPNPHICPLSNETLDARNKHISERGDDKPFICDKCGEQFKYSSRLIRHGFTHSKERPHKCHQCEKGFKNVEHLKSHMIIHTSTGQTHQCNMCEKDFKTLRELKSHMTTHSTERPNQYDVCNKGFKRSQELRRHMLSHGTERQHVCCSCNKTFITLCNLKAHMRIHSTKRTHQCDMCEKDFKSSRDLRSHMISHRTDRPYQCIVCHKGYKRTQTLRKHMIGHCIERTHLYDLFELKNSTEWTHCP